MCVYFCMCVLTVGLPVAGIPQLTLERHCLLCKGGYSNTWQLFHGFRVGFMNCIQGQSINTCSCMYSFPQLSTLKGSFKDGGCLECLHMTIKKALQISELQTCARQGAPGHRECFCIFFPCLTSLCSCFVCLWGHLVSWLVVCITLWMFCPYFAFQPAIIVAWGIMFQVVAPFIYLP